MVTKEEVRGMVAFPKKEQQFPHVAERKKRPRWGMAVAAAPGTGRDWGQEAGAAVSRHHLFLGSCSSH